MLACSACFDFNYEDVEPDDPRLLDRACNEIDACPTTGSAQRTTGITADSIGYRLGPGDGSVTITLAPVTGAGSFVFELLLAGEGQVQVWSTAFYDVLTLSDEYEWHSIAGGTPYGSDSSIEIKIAVTGDAVAELADIRAVGLDYAGCSVRPPLTGAARRRR
jgi:hypothetical protein